MIKFLTSQWTAAGFGAVLYLAATVAFWKPLPLVKTGGSSESSGSPTGLTGASWEFTNPEAEQLITELKAERDNVKKREQQLDALEMRLAVERNEINQATQAVHQLQLDFDKDIVRVQEEETANLKKLAKVYSDMTPEDAAKVFTQMDDHAVVRIMVFMKDNDTAAILDAIAKNGVPEAKRVAALSEILRLATFRNSTQK
jgi:hypothetical protein